jgi:hypothetical protein
MSLWHSAAEHPEMLDSANDDVDSGFISPVLLLRFNDIAAPLEQISRRFGAAAVDLSHIMRCAQALIVALLLVSLATTGTASVRRRREAP